MADEEKRTESASKEKDPKGMGWREWLDHNVHKLDWIDIRLIRAASFLIGLPVGAYFAPRVLPYWWAFILLAVLCYVRPMKHMYGGG